MHNRGITSLIRRCWPVALVAVALFAGCNTGKRDGEPNKKKSSTAAGSAPALPGGGQQTGTTVADVRVDTNRDGAISPDDENGEDTWNASGGAVFLHNNDDDDGDGSRDKDDSQVNGPQDQADLAQVVVRQAPGLGATHTVQLDIAPPASRNKVRLFDSSGAEAMAPGGALQISAAALAAGDQTYYLESTSEITAAWDGNLTVTVTVFDAGNAISQDVAAMRCSPVIFPDNTRPAIRVSLMNILSPQGAPNQAFFQPVNTRSPAGVTIDGVDENTYQWDRWVQDTMQQGYQSMPGQGQTEYRKVIQKCERGSGGLDGLTYALSGVDTGWDYPGGPQSSHNFGGNLEVTPPFANNRFGRMLSGGGTAGTVTGQSLTEHMSQDQIDYMDAQGMQGPTEELSSEWLIVGHIDEYFQFLPDGSGGWKLYMASPDLGRQNLQALAAQGGGGATVFLGRQAQTTVNGILNDAALTSFNQAVQARIDGEEAKLTALMGLQPSQIAYLPVLYEQYTAQGHAVSLNPGVQNLLCVTSATGPNVLFIPDPEGPNNSSGTDIWQTQIRQVFGSGNTIEFVDVFESYHELLGEAHCGVNVERAPFAADWWN